MLDHERPRPQLFRPCHLIVVAADDDQSFSLIDTLLPLDVDPGGRVAHTFRLQESVRLEGFVIAHGWTPIELRGGVRTLTFCATQDSQRCFHPCGDTYRIEPPLELHPDVYARLIIQNDTGTPQRPRLPAVLIDLRDTTARRTVEAAKVTVDLCPECKAPVRAKELHEGGGVQCTKCSWWFCY